MSRSELRQQILNEIVQDYHLEGLDIYLLPMIPLIEMIWADGKVDLAEARLLIDFTNNLLKTLKHEANDQIVVNRELAEKFIKRFLHERPSPEMLKKLRSLSLQLLQSEPSQAKKIDEVLEYCFDIAAATVGFYPYADRERISQDEKKLLHELIAQIQTGKK